MTDEVMVVGSKELRAGDEIVGLQKHGTRDTVSPRTTRSS
jgi:hypothetical protein